MDAKLTLLITGKYLFLGKYLEINLVKRLTKTSFQIIQSRNMSQLHLCIELPIVMPRSATAALALVWALASSAAWGQDVVRVWTRSSAEGRKTYDTIAQAFTQKTGIRVEYFNAWTDFEQRIARAAIGGDLPDLIINDGGATGQFVQMGMLQAVDRNGVAGGADLQDRAWESAKSYDGKYYGVPTSAQAQVMYIRKDWRTKLNLPVPQTWADVEALAKAFTVADPDGNGRADTYGLIFPGSAQRGYAAWYISSFLWQAGGEFVRPVGGGLFKGPWTSRLLCPLCRSCENCSANSRSPSPAR